MAEMVYARCWSTDNKRLWRFKSFYQPKGLEGKFVSKGAGQHDSMVVVFQKKD